MQNVVAAALESHGRDSVYAVALQLLLCVDNVQTYGSFGC